MNYRLVRKATNYYDGSLDRCRSLPVFSVPLSRVVATKLVAKCVPYVRPSFVRVAGSTRVLRFEKVNDIDMMAQPNENDDREQEPADQEERDLGNYYNLVQINIRKFADETTAADTDGGLGVGVF